MKKVYISKEEAYKTYPSRNGRQHPVLNSPIADQLAIVAMKKPCLTCGKPLNEPPDYLTPCFPLHAQPVGYYPHRQNLAIFGWGDGSEPERVDIGTGKIKNISPDGDVEVEFLL